MNIFIYNNYNSTVELNQPEILLIEEFAKLLSPERNKCELDPHGTNALRAFRELTYIYLAIDWHSPYSDYSEQERHKEALNDANITEEEFNDPDFRAACRKYRALQDSNRSIKMLTAARNTVDKFVDYFNNIDVEERNPTDGKPIWKVETIMKEISTLHKVHEELQILESQVKKELAEASSIRGGAEDGFLPQF